MKTYNLLTFLLLNFTTGNAISQPYGSSGFGSSYRPNTSTNQTSNNWVNVYYHLIRRSD
ncbi:hypothetical protein [Fibrella forsythiae]|uniref:Uncharacterized protein n=1 Tax=Fibrella forsythiae TaxID=2817061 RepID=A0ABS3JQB6_9BACT|nr:hypothetical protein [Fibrella forsythiae]MBO0952188.1 hypothetical protein [Fibrella forsythiae]